ncbi:MAG TPA: HDOD domain-containing protein [Gemmata sp.]|nr:HDOD domain-containing protein [Gemmata sp.]
MSALIQAPTSTQSPTLPLLAGSRSTVLATILDPSRLPTPPAVALQIIQAASRPNCRPAEIVALVSRDPALCAKILRAVNSCLYGLAKPVGSLERAIVILGLNPLRSLTLGLSLPATQGGMVADDAMRSYWVSSVSGAILAREIATRMKHPFPEDDLVAGLLSDLGTILMQRAYPEAWHAMMAQHPQCLPSKICEVEEEVFGVNHAEVTAELLHGWHIPEDTVEPIRHHHRPGRFTGASPLRTSRAELLYFVECLTQLDTITHDAAALDQFLTLARDRFNMSQTTLISFLQAAVPKIDEFAGLLNLNIGQCPDFARILCEGSEALVRLTVEANRPSANGNGAKTAHPIPAETMAYLPDQLHATSHRTPTSFAANERQRGGLPEFREEYINRFPTGGCRLDAYELQELLGRGTMGIVFKGYERGLDRYAAVKILSPHLAIDPTARERFAREAKTAASIRHENVVMIYTVGEVRGSSYLAMEYVDGGSLQDMLERDGPSPLSTVIRVAREAAAGLTAAHARQVIHRDIKPANILVESTTGRVKINDFGLARVTTQNRLSAEGSLIGTPLFMAPEQILAHPLDARTDLFALGGVLYILSTGELPFPGNNVTEVLMGVCEVEPIAPRKFRPDLPEWLEAMILRLLRKNPAERFQTAAEVSALVKAKSPQ